MTLPTIISASGLQPQAPATLRANIATSASAMAAAAGLPGYTANLPGSLIEDILSTSVAAVAQIDSARVDAVNSLTPYGANDFLLYQLGQQFGIPIGQATNTSVYVVFLGSPGYPVAKGFTVSDGTYQYVVQDGGIVGAAPSGETIGQSDPLYCLATVSGSWAVPDNTVTELVTSVPSSVTLSCTNLTEGTPGGAAQLIDDYRAQVLQAFLATAQGMPSFVKTLLANVSGVQQRLVSLRQLPAGWEIIVGGGDPYKVAYAIFKGLFDISILKGSTLGVTQITKANPGVVTTDLNHGYSNGQVVTISGAQGMTEVNDVDLTVTVIDDKNFSIGVDTTSYPTYTTGGVLSPNLRNLVVAINDYPDTYQIPIVLPPQQIVAISVTWNTSAENFVSQAVVSQLANAAIVAYINSIPVGQPINVYELESTFTSSIASVLSSDLVTRMVFAVSINEVGVSPTPGTGVIEGDPESYFTTNTSLVVVSQG